MDTITVDTPTGRLRGRLTGRVANFRGIPYAVPPVGDRRFRPPLLSDGWTDERDATEFGPAALQAPSPLGPMRGTFGEDCLNLNVWSAVDGASVDASGPRPVMVWFHGGAFTSGSGAIPWYHGENLVARGAVVVTVNYRLGPLGFLHLEPAGGDRFAGAANLGLADQALALEWVRSNIAAFGGDPGNVTIFGESAGGMSVSTQLALPASAGLFGRAIAQSGAAREVHDGESGERVAAAVLDALGVSTPEQLLDLPAQAFVDCQGGLETGNRAELALPFRPTVDGTSLPARPEEAVAGGVAAGIDLLIGTTSEEMRLFTALGRMNAEMGEERLIRVVERAARMRGIGRDAAEIVSIYRRRLGEATADDVWVAISTDVVFRVPAIGLAEAQRTHAPTRMYLFTQRSTGFGGMLGAAHATEIPYVFDNLDRAGVEQMLGPITDERRRLAAAMADAWVGFAVDGSPRGALADWPAYDADRRATMRLDVEPEVVDAPWDDERAVWM
jgi:para-nitrobenzyl esterase